MNLNPSSEIFSTWNKAWEVLYGREPTVQVRVHRFQFRVQEGPNENFDFKIFEIQRNFPWIPVSNRQAFKAAENDLISDLYNGQSLWLGITDEDEEGNFIGTDGSKINWFNWETNEPDDRNGSGGSSGGKGYSKSKLLSSSLIRHMIYRISQISRRPSETVRYEL